MDKEQYNNAYFLHRRKRYGRRMYLVSNSPRLQVPKERDYTRPIRVDQKLIRRNRCSPVVDVINIRSRMLRSSPTELLFAFFLFERNNPQKHALRSDTEQNKEKKKMSTCISSII